MQDIDVQEDKVLLAAEAGGGGGGGGSGDDDDDDDDDKEDDDDDDDDDEQQHPPLFQDVVDHWKDFEWTTGPVCVTHKGYSWGTPQVWAVTADEGKRVIQHAAGEAGFDADQVGQWGISGSSSSRYGVSLPVKVDTTGGYYWITDRDGSDGRPIVARTSNPYG